MRVALSSALALLAVVAGAVAQGQPRPPGPPTDARPRASDRPPEIVPPEAVPRPPPQPIDWTAKWDELWKRRDEDAAIKQLNLLIKDRIAQDPNGFETSWRLSSLLDWEADGQPDGSTAKAGMGKGAWEWGDKAILANPEDVRGHYFGGTGVGLYSEGVGILTALSQGLEGKFRERLLAALRIDKDFLQGAPQVVWGRYFYKLPWPKRDVSESIKVLSAVVKAHPGNWRAKIYLADSLADDGKEAEAKKLVREVLDGAGGQDPPEEKRVKELARKWISQH